MCLFNIIEGLGLNKNVQYVDVWGLDDDLLSMVPTPVIAVLFLFPITKEVCELYFSFIKKEWRIKKERNWNYWKRRWCKK